MPTEKPMPKKPNIVARFFSAIGRGIAAFFMGIARAIWAVIVFIWELIWTIVTFIYDLIIKIIQATLKYILMVWGFALATVLVMALTVWLLSMSAKNIDETRIGEKLDPAITKITEQINMEIIRDIEMSKEQSKEDMLKAELKRLQEARIDELELQLGSIEAE